jgi:hypothetical protein
MIQMGDGEEKRKTIIQNTSLKIRG